MKRLEALASMPDWPALMSAEIAGAYLGGVAADTFEVIAARRGIRRVRLDIRRVLYRKRDVDALIDSLPFVQAEPREVEPAAEPDAFDEEEAASLARVRAAGRRAGR